MPCPCAPGITGDKLVRKGHILIVETDDLIRNLLERWLSEDGYEVSIATPGAAGTATDPPDLVIANVSTPRGSDLRALRRDYDAPILAVSALFRRGLGASTDFARRLGVRRVLPKPFTRDELLDAVAESLKEPP